MIVYIDPKTFRCHLKQNSLNTLIPYDEPLFDNKCAKFIEGYQLIPEGNILICENNKKISGKMVAPWMDIRILNAYQEQYEEMLRNSDVIEKAAAYDILTEGAYV